MAEYYPLLARAVAALPNATPEARRNVYERARHALVGQLRKIEPPVADADIERESRALDDAAAKLEAELIARPGVEVAGKASAEPPPPSRRPPEVQVPPPQKATQPLRPFVTSPPAPPSPAFPANMSEGGQRRQPAPTVPPPVAPVEREPGRDANLSPPVNAPVPTAAPPASTAPDRRSAVESPFPERNKPASKEGEPAPSRTKADWRSFGRPRRDKSAKPEKEQVVTDGARAGSAAETGKPARARGEPLRPAVPQRQPKRSGFSRHWIVGLVVAVVVVVIAGMAILLKDNPNELVRRAQIATSPPKTAQASGKIVNRVGGAPAQQASTSSAPAPAASAPQPASQTAQQSGEVVPVAQRAALLVQVPGQPQQVKTYPGTVVWRRENVNHGQDQPVSLAVRADIDLPEAKLKATMIFQKNTDATLPASHTIEVRFVLGDGSPIPGVKQIDVPQMRKQDTPSGDPLTGVPAPIMQNYFLVGLTQGDAAVAHNIDLIKSRQWFDIPLLLSDGRIAKITFEKGEPGDRAINDALAAWQ